MERDALPYHDGGFPAPAVRCAKLASSRTRIAAMRPRALFWCRMRACRGNEEAENGPAIVAIRPYAETYDIL